MTGRATTLACLHKLVMGIAALQRGRQQAVYDSVRETPDILRCRRCLAVGVSTLACLHELVVGVSARQGGRQQAVHDEVGVASDGGGEVGVFRDRQRVVPPVLAHLYVPCAEISCHLQMRLFSNSRVNLAADASDIVYRLTAARGCSRLLRHLPIQTPTYDRLSAWPQMFCNMSWRAWRVLSKCVKSSCSTEGKLVAGMCALD